jgi:hypothetical protein
MCCSRTGTRPDLIVMLEGTAEIVKGFGRPGATVIARYGQFQFLGEIGMLTGERACLRERTRPAGVPPAAVAFAAAPGQDRAREPAGQATGR